MSNAIISSMQSFALPNRLQPNKGGSVSENVTDPAQSAEQKFLDYAKKTPAEKLRDSMLASIGLTEDEVKNMSPEQRKDVEQKLTEKIKEAVDKQSRDGGSVSGFFTDISV
jgi:hypothetical protein